MCFKLYSSRDSSVHSTAGVAIRQIVTALFERVSAVSAQGDLVSEEGEEEEKGGPHEKDLSREAGDAYLLFQVCMWYVYNSLFYPSFDYISIVTSLHHHYIIVSLHCHDIRAS